MMTSVSSEGSSTVRAPSFHIIREIYDSFNAHEQFEAELEKALVAKVNYIVIEPPRLGEETGHWIAVGNCLHTTAVVSGLASCIASLILPDKPLVPTPICVISLFCTGLYTVSWNFDPCCQYQVIDNPDDILPVFESKIAVSAPVILKYQPNTKSKLLHRSVALLSMGLIALQIWRTFK